MNSKYGITPEAHARSSRRGNAASAQKVLLDGRYFTWDEIAKMAGIRKPLAQDRYHRAKARGVWPITLENLENPK